MSIEVALFQRQYIWDEERQWQPLCEDIERKVLDALKAHRRSRLSLSAFRINKPVCSWRHTSAVLAPVSSSPKTELLPIVIAVTARTSQSCHVRVMDGKGPKFAPLCPSCGRSMSLTRTIPASPGLCELQTFGRMFCGV